MDLGVNSAMQLNRRDFKSARLRCRKNKKLQWVCIFFSELNNIFSLKEENGTAEGELALLRVEWSGARAGDAHQVSHQDEGQHHEALHCYQLAPLVMMKPG